MLTFSTCLFKVALLTSPIYSDWSALRGLSRHHQLSELSEALKVSIQSELCQSS